MIIGSDMSSVLEIEQAGGSYYHHGIKKDPLLILKDCGFRLIRLRIWNDPYDEEGNPYGAGNCDLETIKILSKRCKQYGLKILLNFHYSDFWADPGKQFVPKAWRNYNLKQLEKAVYDFTYQTLAELKKENLQPDIVAIGNEITNGLLWPIGKVDNFSNLVTLLNAGIKACRDILPSAKIMLHLDNGGNNQLYVNWFDNYFLNGGLDFDYIGLSYYMFWHGTLEDLKNNLNDLANRYGKEMIVAETSYGFTMEDYDEYEELEERTGMILNSKLIEGLPFEISKQGQCEFIETLMKLIDSIDNGLCLGFIYWGGESIPVNGCGWANQAALKYINENGPGGNSWANQALFDYDGNALPILETIKKYNFKK